MSVGFSNSDIFSKLSKYGLSSSGNIQSDLAQLKTAMQAKGESTTALESFASSLSSIGKMGGAKGSQKTSQTSQTSQTQDAQKSQQAQQGQPPWASLMQQLGLELQGSPEADFAAISEKLSEMSASATTPEQQANLASLQSQFEQYQSQAGIQGGSTGAASGIAGLQSLGQIQNSNNQQGQSQFGQNGGQAPNLPWNSLLSSVGLSQQGSAQADFAAISQKLTEMTAADTTGSQASTIATLQSQLAQYKTQTQTMKVRG